MIRKESKKGKAILSFDNAEGLKSIDGNTIRVLSGAIPKPTAVRFGWNESAMPNLVNGAGFPAMPFRTNASKWNYRSQQ